MTDDAIRRLVPDGAGAPAGASDDEIAAWYQPADRTAPWVRVNFVSSIDGAATHDGRSGGLGTPADLRVFDILRRLCDVVVVGAGTVRAEGYGPMRLGDASVAWRVARGLAPHPVFAIVSGRLGLDPASRIFTAAPVRPIVVTTETAPADRRKALEAVADILVCGAAWVDTAAMVTRLAERGLPQIHCEGGPKLFGSMIADGSVDELCLTISPMLEGGAGPRIANGTVPQEAAGMSLLSVLEAGDALLLRYAAIA